MYLEKKAQRRPFVGSVPIVRKVGRHVMPLLGFLTADTNNVVISGDLSQSKIPLPSLVI